MSDYEAAIGEVSEILTSGIGPLVSTGRAAADAWQRAQLAPPSRSRGIREMCRAIDALREGNGPKAVRHAIVCGADYAISEERAAFIRQAGLDPSHDPGFQHVSAVYNAMTTLLAAAMLIDAEGAA